MTAANHYTPPDPRRAVATLRLQEVSLLYSSDFIENLADVLLDPAPNVVEFLRPAATPLRLVGEGVTS